MEQRSHGGPAERRGHCGEEMPASRAGGPEWLSALVLCGVENGERSWGLWGETREEVVAGKEESLSDSLLTSRFLEKIFPIF